MKRSTGKRTAKSPDARRVQSLATQGIELMKAERDAILSGKFDRLDKLQSRKAAVMRDIETRFSFLEAAPETADREKDKELLSSTISILSRRAAENLRLLENAKNGVESGQLIAQSASASKTIEIGLYSPSGTRISTCSDQHATSKTF